LFSLNKNSKSIEFYDEIYKSKKEIKISSNEDFQNIQKFKEQLEYHNNSLAFENHPNQNEYFSNINFGLSHAYMISFMIEYFSDKNSDYSIHKNDTTLQKIIKAHTYVNIAQLANDVITDTSKSLLLITEIKNNYKFNLRNIIKIENKIARIGNKLSISLNTANFIFDLIEIINAKTITERVKSEERLATDLAAASLGFLGDGIAFIAGESATAFSSFLAVPIFGVTYGINAYADVVADVTIKPLEIAKYFYDYENNHYLISDSNVFIPNTSNNILSLAHKNFKNTLEKPEHLNIVISELDLSHNNLLKIKFDSHYIYPTSRTNSYEETQKNLDSKPIFDPTTLFFFPFGENPSIILDKSKAFPFKNSFIPRNTNNESEIRKKLDSAEIQIQDSTKIILPIQPKSFIKYNYQLTPFITFRHDKEIMSAYKIQQNGGFLFEYSLGEIGLADYAIGSLEHEYQKSNINIIIGDKSKKFITPEIPNEFKNFINYNFKSELDGNHFLKISDGANYSIDSIGLENWHFGIDATEIKLTRLIDNSFKINDIVISFKNKTPNNLYIQDKIGRIYKILKSNWELHFFHPKNELDVNKEIDAKHIKNLNYLYEFIEQNYLNNSETNFKFLKIKNHPEAKLIHNLLAPVFYNIEKRELIHIDEAHSFKDINNVDIYHEINGNIIFYNKKEKVISYKNKNGKIYIIKNITDTYKNGENVIVETSNFEHSFYEIREDGVFLVEAQIDNSDFNRILEHKKDFEIADIVTITKRKWPIFILKSLIGKHSGMIHGWYFNDIQKTFIIPYNYNDIRSKLVGYRKEANNSSSLFIYDEYTNKSLLNKVNYKNGQFSPLETISLPENEEILDIKMYLNEPVILSKNGIIYKIDNDFKPYIIAYNQNWLKQHIGKNLNDIINNLKNKNNDLIFLTNDQKVKLDLNQRKVYLYAKDKIPFFNLNMNNNNYYFYDIIQDKLYYINKAYLEFTNFEITKKNIVNLENIITL
ncbi:MAG: hypothetical protein K2X69_02860, partial [Silvanigrellaceae bacterium]|nr:hypothetical protein [Silvanigrellaceae bacterium]